MRCASIIVLAALLPGCDRSNSEPESGTVFTVEVGGQQFKIKTDSEAAIAGLTARLQSGSPGVVHGRLVRGNGGFNSPWGWHLDPASVSTPDLAIELCDALPSYVQQELEHFLSVVQVYCPWGARVVSRQ